MAICTSGRVVKARTKNDLKRVENNKATKGLVAKYNHFRVQFSDGADRHFLFTDKQIKKAIVLANKMQEFPKISWVKEFWYEGLLDVKRVDVNRDLEEHGLPSIAKKLNHIRVNLCDKDIHMLFVDSAIRSALNRARKVEEKLPKVSWLSEVFKEKTWEFTEKSEQEKVPVSSALPSSAAC